MRIKKIMVVFLVTLLVLTTVNVVFADYYLTWCDGCGTYSDGTLSCGGLAYTDYYCEFGNVPFCPEWTTYGNTVWTCAYCGHSFVHTQHKCGTGGHDPECFGYGYSFCPY